MGTTLPTVLAVGAVILMLVAVAAMAAGQLMAAGMSFLSASLVIYIRETRLDD